MATSDNSELAPQVVLYDGLAGAWRRFTSPREVVEARRCDEVMPCLRRIEQLVESEQFFAAGFVSYEAAPAFDRALTVRDAGDFPLLWFGLFSDAEMIEQPVRWASKPVEKGPDGRGSPSYTSWNPSIAAGDYAAVIARLREAIAAGETYQVNYTFRLRQPAGDPRTLFAQLIDAQPSPYAAYIETDSFAICSASPELFFELDGDRIITRPMKGTAARGLWYDQDRACAATLTVSEKDRAENAMIVDMMRNDLGRIARVGSVQVSDVFRVERYPTLWQMTSCVSAETHAPLTEIFAALFPCASVTGAPKASTMRIIAATETAPRKVYTGSIGLIRPGRRATFSVAIRTVLIDRKAGEAEYGIGGGIVWDSTPAGEYDECLLKSRILTAQRPDFSLLETLLWQPAEGYWLLEEHLQRLRASAEYFGIPFLIDAVRDALAKVSGTLRVPNEGDARSVPDTLGHKIRLLVDRRGQITTESSPFSACDMREPVRLELATQPVDSKNVFLYHKTTQRQVYEAAWAGRTSGDDVLLYNERGEATETIRANIAIRIDGQLFTPPISCGLLAGTYRTRLFAEGKLRERVIPVDLLKSGVELYTLNSVRGLQRAVLIDPPNAGTRH